MLLQRSTEPESMLTVSVGHHVSAAGAAYAREKVGHALTFAPEPVLAARVRLTGHRDPAVSESVVAQANVNMQGRPVRVQVRAASTREAVDLLADRLRARLLRLTRKWEAVRHRRMPTRPHEWRHGASARTPLPYFPRPVEDREVLRRKSYALGTETCDGAAAEMDLLDYDFHLFVESGTGQDSVLYHADDAGFRLAQLDPRPDDVARGSTPVMISLAPAIVTDLPGAIARLEVTGWPFVFYRDPDLRRGCVVYHRYDGHYGVIVPSR